MSLTATTVRLAKPKEKLYRLSDGRGLSIEVPPSGRKRWRFRYVKPETGKASMLSLGTYPEISLADARGLAMDMAELVAKGKDPVDVRKEQKTKTRQASKNTFEVIAGEWMRRHLKNKSASHIKRTTSIMNNCILPALGRKQVAKITSADVLSMARIHEKRGATDTAKRSIQICGQIFREAIIRGLIDTDPTLPIRGAVICPPVKHMAATTDPVKVGGYLRAFDAFQGGAVVSVAIRLLPLLFCRPGELRKMRWEDVDLETREWRYTASKTNTDHLVPLSNQAVALLEEIHPLTGHLPGGWVFIGGRTPLRPMSEAAINAAYRRLGIDTKTELTGHGWRSVARTLLHERLNYPPEVIEHQLAHAVPDALGSAYNRTKFIDQRKEMMQVWADYLDKLKAGAEVVKFPATK